MKKVREGLAELSANYKPKLTAIAVTKEHNERLFNKVWNIVSIFISLFCL